MKVKIGDNIYDAENEPIVLIFESDKERIRVASHISNMPPRQGVRLYIQYPDKVQKEIDKIIEGLV